MIKDLVEIFEKSYEERLILDEYRLKEGMYIKIRDDGVREYFAFNKKSEVDKNYHWFVERDYLSNLLDMNKPIDPKKKIHSNNYLSLFVKKDLIFGDKKTTPISDEDFLERINEYFEILEKPEKKYKDKSLLLFQSISHEIDEDILKKCKNYLLDNWDILKAELNMKLKVFEGYIKIFFDYSKELYEQESERYLIPNIFNKNDYNIKVENDNFGLSNNNMGLNSKKAYLEHKTMMCKVPYYINSMEVIMHKKFFDWLATQPYGSLYIPIDASFKGDIYNEIIEKNEIFNCHYLYITHGKEVIIEDYEYLPKFTSKMNLQIRNILGLAEKRDKEEEVQKIEDIDITNTFQLEAQIDSIFLKKRLIYNYFKESKDIKPGNGFSKELKNQLLFSRQAFYQFFRKGKRDNLRVVLNKLGIDLIKLAVKEGEALRAGKIFNLVIALKIYFDEGGIMMAGKINQMITLMKEKLGKEMNTYVDCESDEEFYFLAGQLASFLLSKSKADKKKQDIYEGILRAKNANRIKEELKFYHNRYKHAISVNDIRFSTAFSMVMGYEAEENKVDEYILLAGLLAKNYFYEKKGEN